MAAIRTAVPWRGMKDDGASHESGHDLPFRSVVAHDLGPIAATPLRTCHSIVMPSGARFQDRSRCDAL